LSSKTEHTEKGESIMTDLYCIDLEQFSLEQFRYRLENKDILPSRKILLEKMDERFETLASMGIETLADLRAALRSKAKRKAFSEASGLPVDYLVILRREVNSYISRPFNLEKIPGVNPDYVEKLAAVGVKHTKHLFKRGMTPADRAALAEETGIPGDALLELVKLSDLARIVGVGPVFVRLLYDMGIDTPDVFLTHSVAELLEKAHSDDEGAALSPKDIEYCLETAQYLPRAIEYA
jgi:predicted flap endonuclease-1-like 5' DNA nuclease